MFENYPKVRIRLPLEFQKIYADQYKKKTGTVPHLLLRLHRKWKVGYTGK